jgi:hypothetical protein
MFRNEDQLIRHYEIIFFNTIGININNLINFYFDQYINRHIKLFYPIIIQTIQQSLAIYHFYLI